MTWGAPHIMDELFLLGDDVCETTIAKYMVKRTPDERKRETWRAFLKNHMREAVACDFFTLPTLSQRVLYVFVVLSRNRRKILHVTVNQNPTAEWTAQQLREAFPCGKVPTFLHHDRDAIYDETLRNVFNEYVGYCNESRTHLSLNGNTPDPPEVERDDPLITTPVLGGLHHNYRRAS